MHFAKKPICWHAACTWQASGTARITVRLCSIYGLAWRVCVAGGARCACVGGCARSFVRSLQVSICNADRNGRSKYALMLQLLNCPNLPKYSDPLNKMSRLKFASGTIIVEDLEGNHLRLQFSADDSVTTSKFFDLYVFAPFWVVNCTGYPYLYSAKGGSATAKPGRGRQCVKIKARNTTGVPGIIDNLVSSARLVNGGHLGGEGDDTPRLQTQCSLTFLSAKDISAKKLNVRMKLEGTDEEWSKSYAIGDEGGTVNVVVPCTKRHLAVSVDNVVLPDMFSRSKLVFIQPRYVM